MLKLQLFSKLSKLPTDKTRPIVGCQEISNAMFTELRFHELDHGCRRDLSDKAYLNKIGVIIGQQGEQVYRQSTPWGIGKSCRFASIGADCWLSIQHTPGIQLLLLWCRSKVGQYMQSIVPRASFNSHMTGVWTWNHFRSQGTGNDNAIVLEEYAIVNCEFFSGVPVISDRYRTLLYNVGPSDQYGTVRVYSTIFCSVSYKTVLLFH